VTFRTRIAVGAAAAVAVAVALASSACYLAARNQLLSQLDVSLHRQAALILSSPRALNALTSPSVAGSGLSGTLLVQVVYPDGSHIGNPLPVSNADLDVAGGVQDHASRTAPGPPGVGAVRIYTVPVLIGQGIQKQPAALQLAVPFADVNHTLHTLALVLFLVAVCGIGLALVLGYLVARSSLLPVERLTQAAEHVAATQDLDATIEVTGEDELARLAASFNAMLAAVAASRHAQAQLVADAGHELRTPLTSLRTNVEVLIKMGDLPAEDRQALLADVTAQLEELTTLVGDLVELAREDEQEPEPQDLRLDLIVDRTLERARRRAPSLRFLAHVEPGMVRGQPALLERAILNVLDNAAKWSPPGADVSVWLTRNGANWYLQVHDHGPGIAPDDLPHVFERFYRAPSARALPGSGLGLAIVRQVVQAHAGTVAINSPPDGGTLVTISLPAVDTARLAPDDQVVTPYLSTT
jgi:two-component system sensor histidine kinase MprB